jgi:hypothetical protein
MPIVPSRSRRIQELLERLASPRAGDRDSAVAGLTLLGPRVVEPIGAFLPGAGPEARRAALEVLERLADRAALPPILQLVGDGDEAVALRAIETAASRPDPRAVPALGRVLAGPAPRSRRRAAAAALARLQGAGLVEALDPLAGRLLDEREDPSLRVAILEELLGLHPPLAATALRPLLAKLASSTEPELVARVAAVPPPARRGRPPRPDPGGPRAAGPSVEDGLVAELLAPGLAPEAAARVTAALVRRGAPVIPLLLGALERLGPLRRGRTDAGALRARAALHEALAALDSRAALYDLREALEARPAMPALLRAAGRVGDASVVPALARAVAEDPALLEPCADTLAAIVAREKLRRTGATSRAVRPEHRTAFDLLWARAKARPPR